MTLPLLPPPNVDLETRDILRLCSQTHRVLGELKGVGALLPNPTILVNSIPLLEAQSSSEIENIVDDAGSVVSCRITERRRMFRLGDERSVAISKGFAMGLR